MPKIDANSVEKYQLILQKDPNSQVFAPLAEAYREMGLLQEADRVALLGVKRHPTFAGGLVVYAKILKDLGKLQDSLKVAQKAAQLSPENLIGHQLQAEIYLQTKQPKEALKSYKMVLFLNPQNEKARKAVTKLESLTADEYEDEIFEMSKLDSLKDEFFKESRPPEVPRPSPQAPVPTGSPTPALERMLSLIDAFIVRNDIQKAKLLLSDTQVEFGDHPEILQRIKMLHSRSGSMMASLNSDQATPLKPLVSREKAVAQRKLETLEMMLRKIEEYRQL